MICCISYLAVYCPNPDFAEPCSRKIAETKIKTTFFDLLPLRTEIFFPCLCIFIKGFPNIWSPPSVQKVGFTALHPLTFLESDMGKGVDNQIIV